MMTLFRRGCGAVAGAWLLVGLAFQPAMADEVSPEGIDLAKKVLIAVGLKASMDQIVPSMLGQLQGQMLQMHPEMGKVLHETLLVLLPEFSQGEDAVFTDTAHVLATKLSVDELKQTLTYFDSEAGKKYRQAQAPVLEELAASGGLWREKLTKIMLDRTREEMGKKGFQF